MGPSAHPCLCNQVNEVCASLSSASRKVTSKESRVKGEDRGFSPPPDPMHDPLRVGPPRGPRGRVPPYGR